MTEYATNDDAETENDDDDDEDHDSDGSNDPDTTRLPLLYMLCVSFNCLTRLH